MDFVTLVEMRNDGMTDVAAMIQSIATAGRISRIGEDLAHSFKALGIALRLPLLEPGVRTTIAPRRAGEARNLRPGTRADEGAHHVRLVASPQGAQGTSLVLCGFETEV